jgi:hypothetical protein
MILNDADSLLTILLYQSQQRRLNVYYVRRSQILIDSLSPSKIHQEIHKINIQTIYYEDIVGKCI